MRKRVVYRYTGEKPMPWRGKTLTPGQFISLETYRDLGKGLTITQVVHIKDEAA